MLIKSLADQKNLRENGKRMGVILEKLVSLAKPGVSTKEIDRAAEKMIIKAGGRPAFKGYKTHVADRPFPATICASLNTEIVHGIPRQDVILKDGDIFSIDIGMEWPSGKKNEKLKTKNNEGVFSDTAITLAIGKIPEQVNKLLNVTREALEVGILASQPGRSVASIGKAIEAYVKSQGKYGIVRDLVGHGVGHAVHEEPMVPNFYDSTLEKVILQPGMVIAIEPMISLGGWRVETMSDGWTIKMADNSLCAHFEHSLIINQKGNEVFTRRPSEILKS